MTLKEIFNYTLLTAKEFDVTVFEVFTIILILVGTSILVRVLKRIFNAREQSKRFDSGRSHAILQILRYVIWIMAILFSMETIGIKITLLLAGSAALLVGLGLGLQQIFQDIMSGVTILFEGVLKVGDIVEIEDNVIGKVKETGLRTSKIETRDNIILIVPNSKFVNDIVINWSHLEKKTRFRIEVGVAYGSDVQKVTELLLKCAKENEKVSKTPQPFVRFNDFGESSLDFQLFFWTTDTFYVENTKSLIRYAIDAAFRENGVQIPFPQRDVHIKSRAK